MTSHVVIIGAYGSGGVAVANELATESDIELTLIDNGDPGGGLCILRGCMPSKEVISAGAHRYQSRQDHRIPGDPPDIDLESVVETKNEHTSNFAAHRRGAVDLLTENENVEFIHGTAQFIDDRTIKVGDRTIDPDYTVIATGSEVNIPDISGIKDISYMTSADVLDATTLPDSGIVIGFGAIGIELVPYLSEAGDMDLTVIEHDARPLDEADPEFGDTLLDIYRQHFGVEILTHTYEKRLEQTDNDGVRLHIETQGEKDIIEADQLFVFTGRKPNLEGLGLENTVITPGKGWVHDTMQTRDDPRVFVVGDANGHEPVLHVAKEQGFLVADNILRHRSEDSLVPYQNTHHHVTFSGLGVYPYARVGHSETSAREEELDYIAVTRDASDDGVFQTKDVPHGLATLIVDANDGTVLGYQGLHYHADVMAKTIQIAVEMGLDVRDIPDRAYHPTTPEILDGIFRDAKSKLS